MRARGGGGLTLKEGEKGEGRPFASIGAGRRELKKLQGEGELFRVWGGE